MGNEWSQGLTALLAEEALGVVLHALDLHAPRRDRQSALGAVDHDRGGSLSRMSPSLVLG